MELTAKTGFDEHDFSPLLIGLLGLIGFIGLFGSIE
jgi:LPXTG-motif cell wall-anchored protein